jgi:hypothetical protein
MSLPSISPTWRAIISSIENLQSDLTTSGAVSRMGLILRTEAKHTMIFPFVVGSRCFMHEAAARPQILQSVYNLIGQINEKVSSHVVSLSPQSYLCVRSRCHPLWSAINVRTGDWVTGRTMQRSHIGIWSGVTIGNFTPHPHSGMGGTGENG